jgi:hypothetical protein
MRTLSRALLAASLFVPMLGSSAAFAQHDWHDHWGGDIHHFGDYDMGRWRAGAWWHGFHDGRAGWWWVVGPDFYFYPAPIYPYPDPYVPPAVAPTPAAATWYYCANPQGYYPYVPSCAVPWQPVPAR